MIPTNRSLRSKRTKPLLELTTSLEKLERPISRRVLVFLRSGSRSRLPSEKQRSEEEAEAAWKVAEDETAKRARRLRLQLRKVVEMEAVSDGWDGDDLW